MQWNADGICPKLLELCDKIINSVSDIVATPESKLRKADKTPSIEGYSTIHKDWNNILGTGLLFFIYNGMIFEKLQSLKKTGMEILSIWVCTSKSLWIEIYNIYIPNITTKQTHFDPNLINPFLHSIIIGSFTSLGSFPTTQYLRWQDHGLDHQQGPARFNQWLCYSHQLNYREWQYTQLVTLWLQLVNQNIMVTGRTYWQFGPLANFHRNQPHNQIPTSHPKKGLVVLQWHPLVLFYQGDWITDAATSGRV